MKKAVPFVLPLVLSILAGCSSSQPGKSGASPAPAAAPTPTAAEQERAKAAVEAARRMAGVPDSERPDTKEEPWIIVTDEKTGRKLQRIPKNPTLRAEGGKLRHTLLNPAMFTLDLVREDDKYYYVDAPEEAKTQRKAAVEEVPEGLAPIADVPAIEYEVVTPRVSKSKLRFEEKSAGLPIAGFWRSNMQVADLDGDGSPEIVTPPPRLAGGWFRVFRFDGAVWQAVPVQVESADPQLRFQYGGVAVADMDGDGKPDVLGVGHGSGPVVAYNLGGFRFRLEARGLPREMSGRAIEAGDLDGDGRLDIVAVSDEPEASKAAEEREQAAQPGAAGAAPGADAGDAPGGYRKGFDVRAFLSQPDGSFRETTAGVENACFGYSLGLAAPPKAGGAPFFVSGCRYQGGRAFLFEWDRNAKTFRQAGRDVVEQFSFHSGSAVGTYKGFPAAFSTYVKGNAPGAVEKPVRGHGVTAYYRDGSAWKAKRVTKVLADQPDEAAGIGVGDVNGDGLDDVAWADDSVGRVRVFLQTAAGEFEELDPALQPRFVNHSMSVKVVDVDRDGRNDIVLMFEYRSTDKTRAGGIRFFRNQG